jgi:pimeloyl-ACP methyl ester carboxylesterase
MRPVSRAWTIVSLAVMLSAACAADGPSLVEPEVDELAALRDPHLAGSLVPGFPDVLAEYVQIPGARTTGTPAALDTGAFLRVRSAVDREHPRQAQAVIIAMPGFSSVPAHWLFLAAQLVHKANTRSCDGARGDHRDDGDDDRDDGGRGRGDDRDGDRGDGRDDDRDACRVEVWVIDRRGSNLEDTAGTFLAHLRGEPMTAVDYYFGRSILGLDPERPGKFPFIPPQNLPGQPDATFRPLEQSDVPFVAEWGFEAHAGDVDRMIALVRERGGKSIFLAGHSQGGAFISSYAGRRGPDGRRGTEKIAGLIALDPAPLNGRDVSPSQAQLDAYFAGLTALRTGATQVFTNGSGALPNYNGPRAGALTAVAGVLFDENSPDAESILAIRQFGTLPFSPAGDAFLRKIRITTLAASGMGIDTDPLPGRFLQNGVITALGEGLGRLDFTPLPGTETACDPASPPGRCVPSVAQIDPNRVYGWIEGGGNGGAQEVGKARLFGQSLSFSPTRTNVRPVVVRFPTSGLRLIYAGDMNAATWYPSVRYDSDMTFVGTFHSMNLQQNGVSLDIDRDAIDVPVYMARRTTVASNVNPLVTDYTEINRTGVTQTAEAAALTPIDPAINVALYTHTDFVSADDARAGEVTPGQPGASAVADTLIDWVMARAQGRARTPSPGELGVRRAR